MISQFIDHIFADPFLLWCSVTMLLLALVDLAGIVATYLKVPNFKHIDFKTTIVSIGLFATFFGVLVGLYGFDPKNIAQSVPHLLEGLRFAFGASVLGMFLSVGLSILQKLAGGDSEDEGVLHSIDRKMGSLVSTLQSPDELVRQFVEMKKFLKSQLGQINDSLNKALVQLGQGATAEITQALEKVITDFNENLKSQFGDNFKELNRACLNLITWQEKYKNHVESAERGLSQVISSLQESCAAVKELTSMNQETKEVCRQVGGLIGTYDVQIKTLATHLESCKKLGEQAGEFLVNTEKSINLSSQNLSAFSHLIEHSVSKQSETLAQLTKEIDQQLPKALGELEKTLTGITHEFAADYRSLFKFITDHK